MDWFDEFTTLHGLPRPDREPAPPSIDLTRRNHDCTIRLLTNRDIAACVAYRSPPRYAVETPGIYQHHRTVITFGVPFWWWCTFGGPLRCDLIDTSMLTVTGYEIEVPTAFVPARREALTTPFTPTARGDQLRLDFPAFRYIPGP